MAKRNRKEAKRIDAKKRRHVESTTVERRNFIPPEIIYKILLNLPVKSLLRFSSVSKSWKSTISASWFIKKYRGNGILIATSHDAETLSSLNLPDDQDSIDDATTLFCPMWEKPRILAFSNELFMCVQVKTSLFLWNPSINKYREIQNIPRPHRVCGVCGLGYDAFADDYKLLYICDQVVMLYSLRSDSWRKIQQPRIPLHRICKNSCVSVNGILHWKGFRQALEGLTYAIVSFDLSTEKFRGVARPKEERWKYRKDKWQITASKGKLCVCFDLRDTFVMWTMNDYGVAESWTKTLNISFDRGPIQAAMNSAYSITHLYSCDDGRILFTAMNSSYSITHLYSYDDGRILFKASNSMDGALIFVYEGNIVRPIDNVKFKDCFFHVESLISPDMW